MPPRSLEVPVHATLTAGLGRKTSHTEAAIAKEAEMLRIRGTIPSRAMLNQWTRANINKITSVPDNQKTLMTLAKTMAIMAVLPLGGFFISYRLCVDVFGAGMDRALAIAGILAVILVNMVSIGYAYYAGWLEE
eukprot:TRINITY_DN5067_c0_g1_i2.p1 TRINITY_DN5067_c0_g1~~TRINITY_DN5067_c0_g1_i2.p1  ORF type:complete len:134 (-),score=21.95 TRINITY_DN5067_c0_g1_i2:352-753(-)